jgi:hypothetical protein
MRGSLRCRRWDSKPKLRASARTLGDSMWGSGQGDLNFAEFQAKLLAGPQPDDPVEDHMNAVMWLIGWWTALLVAIAGVVTWFSSQYVAVIGVLALTVVALAVVWRRTPPDSLPNAPA